MIYWSLRTSSTTISSWRIKKSDSPSRSSRTESARSRKTKTGRSSWPPSGTKRRRKRRSKPNKRVLNRLSKKPLKEEVSTRTNRQSQRHRTLNRSRRLRGPSETSLNGTAQLLSATHPALLKKSWPPELQLKCSKTTPSSRASTLTCRSRRSWRRRRRGSSSLRRAASTTPR